VSEGAKAGSVLRLVSHVSVIVLPEGWQSKRYAVRLWVGLVHTSRDEDAGQMRFGQSARYWERKMRIGGNAHLKARAVAA